MSNSESFDALPAFIPPILERIIADEKVSCHSVEVNSGSQVGDGFLGELFCVVITGKCGSSEKTLNLLCKLAPSNKNRRREFFADIVFSREAYFYNKVLPAFIDFQREKGLSTSDQFNAFVKCYAALADDQSEQYAIIMDDLRANGFRMWNKAKPTTIENARLGMREMGKFHGISFALKHQRPDVFDEFRQLVDISREFFKSPNLQGLFQATFARALSALRCEQHKEIITELNKNTQKYFEECLNENSASRFGVVAHGDFWNNNILYRFNEDDIAEDIRLIDWQVLRYISPAVDLLYNIFSSTDKKLRDKEYNNLLKVYHDSLSKTIRLLGSDPDDLFTFDDLLSEMKRCGNFALLISPMLIQIAVAEAGDISNLDDMCDKAENGELPQDLIKGLSDTSQQKYEDRLNDCIGDLVTLGYFHKIED